MNNKLEELKSLINDIFKINVEIEERKYPDIEENQESYYIKDFGLEILGEFDTTNTPFKKEHWFVYGEKYYPATRWEPEDVDVFEISNHKYYYQAVESTMFEIMKQLISQRAESKMEMEWEENGY